jgi:hypothetical protein
MAIMVSAMGVSGPGRLNKNIKVFAAHPLKNWVGEQRDDFS